MRAIWKGAISFGLVNIPTALISAVKKEELKFRLLRKSDSSPIRYQRVAEADGQEVPWDQTVKGFEYEPGRFVVLRAEDFKRADGDAAQTICIVGFVSLSEIEPLFFDKPYFLEPQKGGGKAYALLRDTLQHTGKVGIAKVVLKTRQYLAAVKPMGEVLLLQLMHFASEIVQPSGFQLPAEKPSKKELEMAQLLVQSMTEPWNPEVYTDEHRAALLQMIQQKVQTGEKPSRKSTGKPVTGKVVELIDILQQSLAQTGQRQARKPRGKKAA
jgi:DNA end-binding protein Ku